VFGKVSGEATGWACILNLPLSTSDFVLNNYVAIKKANPTLPILVREAEGVEARAFARFGKLSPCPHVLSTTILIPNTRPRRRAQVQAGGPFGSRGIRAPRSADPGVIDDPSGVLFAIIGTRA
jgi:hypothetical protein